MNYSRELNKQHTDIKKIHNSASLSPKTLLYQIGIDLKNTSSYYEQIMSMDLNFLPLIIFKLRTHERSSSYCCDDCCSNNNNVIFGGVKEPQYIS